MANSEPNHIGGMARRLRKFLSQEELAEHSSLTLRTIVNMEANKQEPRLSTLYSLATAFDLDIIDFMKEVHHYFIYD